jgi:DNA sulfur modification protein DndB
MAESSILDPLVTGDSLLSELKIRSKEFYEVSVSKKKVPIHEESGWHILRENKNNCRMRLNKVPYELIEDEVWSLYARLGFVELNKNRELRIKCGETSSRKVDVFAKDDETVIISECTSSEVAGTKKSLTKLIDKIKSYRDYVVKAVHGHYGAKFRPKFGWVIATRNIVWTENDLERAKEADITVLRDEDLEYYSQLQKHLKTAARYQLLANIFEGKSVKGLALKVPATKGSMGGSDYYTFSVRPADLMKIAYVGHKNSKGPEAIETYQRMLKTKRLMDIAEYINDGGKFPTNIVVNLQYKKNPSFSKKDQIGDLTFGELRLPSNYASAWVIDGQHRLYGYALSDRANDSVVPVLAFVNLDSTSQKKLFVDINHKQVKVPQGLLLDLYSELHWGSDDSAESLTSLCSKITKVLNTGLNSPFKDRVIVGEKKKTPYTCLTITTIAMSLFKEQLVGVPDTKQNSIIVGPLGDVDLKKALKRATAFLSLYFGSIKEAIPDQWELGDAPGGYICTNNATVAFLKVLRAIFDVLFKKYHLDLNSLSVDDLFQEVEPYSRHLTSWLNELDEKKFVSLRSKVGSKGQIAVSWEMQQAIHGQDEGFQPNGLIEWMESFDRAGTENTKKLIDQIQLSMNKCVLGELEKEHGKKWWFDGVPNTVRTKCATRREEEKGIHDAEQYLDLIDYKTIAFASSHWSKIFQKYFVIDDEQGDKKKKLSWMSQLNDIRKTVSHPERGLLTTEQVSFVKSLHQRLEINLLEYWQS